MPALIDPGSAEKRNFGDISHQTYARGCTWTIPRILFKIAKSLIRCSIRHPTDYLPSWRSVLFQFLSRSQVEHSIRVDIYKSTQPTMVAAGLGEKGSAGRQKRSPAGLLFGKVIWP